MKAFVSLGGGQAGWAEKEIPQATGFDGVLRPLLVSPCTSDVHNVAIDCLAPNRTLGHEGLGEIVAVGDQVNCITKMVCTALIKRIWRRSLRIPRPAC